MRSGTIVLVLASAFALQPAHGQGRGNGNPHPVQSVAGRTYCAVVDWVTTIGISNPDTNVEAEWLDQGVLRGVATFDHSGNYYRQFLSQEADRQYDNGVVSPLALDPFDVIGSYVQSAGKLNMVLDVVGQDDTTLLATWYVSKDGSVIQGTLLRYFDNGDAVTSSQKLKWSLIEGDDCDP
jgi:hypothetical protein